MSRTRTLSRTEISLLSVKIDTIRRDYSRRGVDARKQTSQGTAIYSAEPLFLNLPTGCDEERPAMVSLFYSPGRYMSVCFSERPGPHFLEGWSSTLVSMFKSSLLATS